MPYIRQEQRKQLRDNPFAIPHSPGELNYLITKLCQEYIFWKAPAPDYVPNYQCYNDAIGALECAKQELYRRSVVPFEENKIKENGDVVHSS